MDIQDMTMNEIIELAKTCQHKRKKNAESHLKYYYDNHAMMKEKNRISAKKYYDIKKAKKLALANSTLPIPT